MEGIKKIEIDEEFTNKIVELEDGYIKTPHGIFTPNEVSGLTAYDVYEQHIYDSENPTLPKPNLEELVEKQSKKITILESKNKESNKKIDTLNSQNANLLFDNAKKEIEIKNLNKNLANTILEIASMKAGV
ncbi:MAG: hypothetical protein ACRCW0_06655 [Clostridium sp.]